MRGGLIALGLLVCVPQLAGQPDRAAAAGLAPLVRTSAGLDLANADRVFSPEIDLATGDVFSHPTLFDIDGDGDLDLFAAEQRGVATLWRWENDRFEVGSTHPVPDGHEQGGSAAGDLDGDGDLDLVQLVQLADRTGSTIRVLRNDGGELTPLEPHERYGPRMATVSLFDIDADGDLDAIAAQKWTTTPPLWFRNDGPATGFTAELVPDPRDEGFDRVVVIDPITDRLWTGGQPYPQLASDEGQLVHTTSLLWEIRDAEVADFDGDGQTEVLVARADTEPAIEAGESGDGLVTVRWSREATSFTLPRSATELVLLGTRGPQLAALIRGDGDRTRATVALNPNEPMASQPDSPIQVQLMDEVWRIDVVETEAFFETPGVPATDIQPLNFDPAEPHEVQQLLQSHDGVERIAVSDDLGPVSCWAAAAGDFDNDGDIDGLLGCGGPQRDGGVVLLANHESQFTPHLLEEIRPAREGLVVDDLAVADIDGDGRLDVVVTRADLISRSGSLRLHLGQRGEGATLDLGAQNTRLHATALLSTTRVHTFSGLDGRVHVGGVVEDEPAQVILRRRGVDIGALMSVGLGSQQLSESELAATYRDFSLRVVQSPRSAHVGEPVSVILGLSNDGTAPLDSVEVVALTTQGDEVGRATATSLAPGTTTTVNLVMHFPAVGTVDWVLEASATGLGLQREPSSLTVLSEITTAGRSQPWALYGVTLGAFVAIAAMVWDWRHRRRAVR